MKSSVNYGFVVLHCARGFTRMLQDGIARFGITAGEFRVLRVIQDDGPLVQAQIAQLAAMDRPFVAALIKKLESKGLVAARRHKTDRRRVDVVVTARGIRLAGRINAGIVATTNEVAARGISATDVATFVRVSRLITANLENHFLQAASEP